MAEGVVPMTTGLVTKKCYAAHYQDCDGGPATREHWLTKALLERIQYDGTGLLVDGLAWHDGARASVESELTSRILCDRHHRMLSGLDGAVVALHDAWLSAAEGKPTSVVIQGEYLERWALKVLVGMTVSGAARLDGIPVRAVPSPAVLDVVFGMRDLSPPRGFHFVVHRDSDDGYKVKIDRVTPGRGHELEGVALGITIQILSFRFMTLLLPMRVDPRVAIYRPAGIDFGSKGRIDLRWKAGPATPHIPIALSMSVSKRV